MTPTQNRQIHAILKKLNIPYEHKYKVVEPLVPRPIVSWMEDISIDEAKNIISNLNAQANKENSTATTEPKPQLYDSAQKQRLKCIAIAHQLGWKLPNDKADISRINEWCIQYGFWHTPFNALTSLQLNQIVTQLQSMLQKQNAALRKIK